MTLVLYSENTTFPNFYIIATILNIMQLKENDMLSIES